MKLEEYQNTLKELETRFGAKSSKSLIKVIDMAHLQTLDKIDQQFNNFRNEINDFRNEIDLKIDQKFNNFRKEMIEDRKDIHKSINAMVFKIVGLLGAIIAIIKFMPEIFN